MVGERALRAAIEIYGRWEAERERTPADRIVSAEFRSRRYLNSGERRWVSEAVYGCVRYRRRQQWLLERLGLPVTPEYIVRLWAEAPAGPGGAISTQETGFHTPPVAPVEAIVEAFAALPGIDHPVEHIRITQSFPDDLTDALIAQLGIEAIAAAQALNAQAPTTLRVNPLRVSREHLRKNLPDAKITRFSPWGLELPRRVNVHDLPGYRTGWFEIQEEASQLTALLVDPLPGQRVVEVGAGAGGKTLALAALMEDRGSLLALDTNAARLEELRRRAERAGVTCVEPCQVASDEMGAWQPSGSARRTINRMWGRADCVLVDAPCTGSGVLRRSPDAKWRELDCARLAQLQRSLLTQAALLVAPNGHLIYVTCAFERDQNETIIESFLGTEVGGQFVVEPISQRLMTACDRAASLASLPPSLRSAKARKQEIEETADGEERRTGRQATLAGTVDSVRVGAHLASLLEGSYLRTWPHRHGLDAFFAACLRHS